MLGEKTEAPTLAREFKVQVEVAEAEPWSPTYHINVELSHHCPGEYWPSHNLGPV